MVKVFIPVALQQYAENKASLEIEGESVGEILEKLSTQFPDLKEHLFNEDKLRSFVNVFVNGKDIRGQENLDTPVSSTDEIRIIPSIAGGELSKEEILRYSRHLIMPEVGMEGQEKLRQAKVLLVGAGGLGSPISLYLAAAGIGTLGLVDFDVVDYSNLQRQIIHTTKDVGRKKLESAKEKIEGINPGVEVNLHEERLTSQNALEILKEYDIIIDGTDNFPTRYLVNDACVLLKKPNIYGSIFRFEGQATVFYPGKGPCYRCLYPEPPPPGLVPSCAEGGVLGILPGIIGTIQATEAIKLILGKGDPLTGRLLLFNGLGMKFTELEINKNPSCPLCGENPTIKELIDYEGFCGIPPKTEEQWEISPQELKPLLGKGEVQLIDVREKNEWDICKIEGAKLIPTSEFPKRINELNSADSLVIHCHHGPRSERALHLLREAGFKKIKFLKGGIDTWAEKIDSSMPRY